MKKIISILLCLAMVLSFALVASAESTTVTASKSVADLITQYGWTDTTTKQEFMLDDVVTVKINGGSNTGKAYSGNHIRIYATDSPAGTITISVPDGCELVSVKISTMTGTYAHLCVDGTTTDISNQSTSVSGNSVVLNSVKNGSEGKQVRVTAFEVVYTTSGSAPEHQHNSDVVKFDATGHWTECTCGENKSTVTAHTLTNHICECGFVGDPTTAEEILKCLYTLPAGGSIPGTKTLTGKVTAIDGEGWSTEYNNITVTIVVEGYEDYPVVCFRLKSGDADASTIEVNDIITVSGTLINYKGYDGTTTKEFNSGCTLDALTKPTTGGGDVVNPGEGEGEGGGDVVNPGEGEGDVEVTPPSTDAVTAPIAGVAYNFMMNQVTNGHAVYLDGTVSTRYLGTTTDASKAITIYAETAEGGYKFYTFIDGAKSYIEVYFNSDNKVSIQYSANGSVFTYVAETNIWMTNLDGTDYYLGSYNNFDTISASKTSYISAENTGVSQFPLVLVADQIPDTGDSFTSVVIAMMAISAIGAGILLKKKEF